VGMKLSISRVSRELTIERRSITLMCWGISLCFSNNSGKHHAFLSTRNAEDLEHRNSVKLFRKIRNFSP